MASDRLYSTLSRAKAAAESSVLTLEVWRLNERAVAFYRRRGFSVIATTDDPHTGLEKLVMRKALEPLA